MLLTSEAELENSSEYLRVKATRGRLVKKILTPQTLQVGASTTLKIEFSAEHDIPADAYIFVEFPKWNPQNPDPVDRKPYI